MFSHKVMESFERAKKVVVVTGAGISAESGVPAFRGANGLWRRYRAEDLATPHASARRKHEIIFFCNFSLTCPIYCGN